MSAEGNFKDIPTFNCFIVIFQVLVISSHYVKSPIFVQNVDFEILISFKIQPTLICRKYVTLISDFCGFSCPKSTDFDL